MFPDKVECYVPTQEDFGGSYTLADEVAKTLALRVSFKYLENSNCYKVSVMGTDDGGYEREYLYKEGDLKGCRFAFSSALNAYLQIQGQTFVTREYLTIHLGFDSV